MGYIQILEELGDLVNRSYDTSFDFNKQFEVVIQDCQTGKRCETSVSLGTIPTIFQAEILATEQCAQEYLKNATKMHAYRFYQAAKLL